MSTVGEEDLDIFVVGDYAVVDHQELILRVTSVRMTVDVGGGSVGRPSCVSDANVTIQNAIKVERLLLGVDLLLQQLDFALGLDNPDGGGVDVIQSQASTVIPTVLQSLQPLQQQFKNLLASPWCQKVEIRKYSTHDPVSLCFDSVRVERIYKQYCSTNRD